VLQRRTFVLSGGVLYFWHRTKRYAAVVAHVLPLLECLGAGVCTQAENRRTVKRFTKIA
jgi:hypothetical protein